jgi:hypothetical protein
MTIDSIAAIMNDDEEIKKQLSVFTALTSWFFFSQQWSGRWNWRSLEADE